jgi:hypothetical protein
MMLAALPLLKHRLWHCCASSNERMLLCKFTAYFDEVSCWHLWAPGTSTNMKNILSSQVCDRESEGADVCTTQAETVEFCDKTATSALKGNPA